MKLKENDIALCVTQSLERYFSDLDGETPADLYAMVMRQVERPLLESVMTRVGGNQTQAAEILGITRNTLRRKLTDHGLL
ncbi:MAG: Fis family transcriptional regulator [Candidatus Dactylopiibacterium carminicum]|uniref:Putative Fis-like DNA-binding protein n=1 Tax=Candidatus Dactylopiibacterium carminicum TaxID=857335 RepID=A0A272EVA9_9RHOO|nr:helix-turn-helix domain-containing protein [Candidatus Dactylopiibacterium carminicum]KAF7600139.1 Fis family transcriptional regulator [Candidatus Dactylopiibacterium carminicum]PAS94032.1 MAG: Fis family transcriptional regulator [Candidatus Dactylopiibacterium carminicum]PAS98205.1 MAG: Fis family transcriptional regulator [Candidatus Dactylopiibacterium carminicum]PAT00138.1 MAG: Fis family transcriptional regulator [Candidatus Dactylopiibacterium carminicum]